MPAESSKSEFTELSSLFGGNNPNCIRCGLCLPFCPTYRETSLEGASPRGRIALMKALIHGDLEPEDIREQLYLCLDCRACETACPSGVRFGALLEKARVEMERRRRYSLSEKLIKALAFNYLLPHQKNLNRLADMLRLYQVSGAQKLARRTGLLKFTLPGLHHAERLLPAIPSREERGPLPEKLHALTPARDKVAFFTGCVMQVFYPHVNRDTAEILRFAGCDVVVPGEQCCCGALHLHRGQEYGAKTLARRNIDAFERAAAARVVVNSAGCGALLKEYHILLKDDPAYAQRARAFSESVMDVSEYLDVSNMNGNLQRLDMAVVYDEPCHLLHAQGISSEPRRLIASIPGVNILPLPEADRCCGGAGIYNMTHRDISLHLLDHKMDFIKALHPDAIVTANPGCMIQLGYGVRRWKLKIPVWHTLQFLRKAITEPPDDSSSI